jgi:hypothetical protein
MQDHPRRGTLAHLGNKGWINGGILSKVMMEYSIQDGWTAGKTKH